MDITCTWPGRPGSKSYIRMAGRILGISPKTVNGYIERVRVKYAAAGRAAPTKSILVQRALDDGLITFAELSSGDEQWPGSTGR